MRISIVSLLFEISLLLLLLSFVFFTTIILKRFEENMDVERSF